MTPPRPYSRHGLTAPMVRIKLAGFGAIDRRTAAARATLAFKHELIAALGGEADLSPQRRKLIDMAARASLLHRVHPPKGDQRHDDINDALERFLGLR